MAAGSLCSPEWLCCQFDNAVSYFGRWFDNRVQETDSKGRRRWNPDDLLKDRQPTGIEAFHKGLLSIGAKRAVATKIHRRKQK